MKDPEDTATDFDDYEPTLGADFDADDFDDGETGRKGLMSQAAWQRLDERKDDQWLREQLADWDDWDDDADLH